MELKESLIYSHNVSTSLINECCSGVFFPVNVFVLAQELPKPTHKFPNYQNFRSSLLRGCLGIETVKVVVASVMMGVMVVITVMVALVVVVKTFVEKSC